MPRNWVAILATIGALGCSTAQGLRLPPRGAGARAGSAMLPLIRGLTVQEREALLWQEFAAGNVPAFVREFVPVVVRRPDTTGRVREIRYEVLPDYLAFGSDQDFFRMPMTPTLGQQIADLLDCSLPTRRMVDDIWAAAPVQLQPTFFDPNVYDIVSPDIFWQHHQRVEVLRAGRPLGALTAGTKKDVVITARLASVSNRVAIYGWHRTNGQPIQPLYTGHVDWYADYSHGIRLVRNRVLVDGQRMTVAQVLAHPILHPLLSDEGAFTSSRYPTPTPDETFPFHDAFPSSGPQLGSWRAKFTAPQVVNFTPPAPGGDGYAVVVQDPRGGTDSLRCGAPTTTDQVVQAEVYCDYRPGLAADGFERVGVFARDRAAGAFDGTLSQAGACYALCWDSHDGRLWCMRAAGGSLTDLLPAPLHLRTSAWHRFRIEARGAQLRFLVDGQEILATTDATHAQGECGLGHHEFFATNSNARGTQADNFFADVPDALDLALDQDTSGRLVIETRRGVPFDLYFRPITVVPGAFPDGWFYGLDPAAGDLAAQLGSPPPLFVGLFDARGRADLTLPVPPGLDLQMVALDLDRSIEPLSASRPAALRTR